MKNQIIEAEFHLCHAYAEVGESTYNPVEAIPHCEKASVIYDRIESKSEGDLVIIDLIDGYLSELKLLP